MAWPRVPEALPLSERLAPDLVLTDLSLSDGSGVELIRALYRRGRRENVLVLSGFGDGHLVAEALDAGASGYVLSRLGS